MTASADEQTYQCLNLLAESHRRKASRLDPFRGSDRGTDPTRPANSTRRTTPFSSSHKHALSDSAMLSHSTMDNPLPEWVRFLQRCAQLLHALSTDLPCDSAADSTAAPAPPPPHLPNAAASSLARRDVSELLGSVYLGTSFALPHSSCYGPAPTGLWRPDPPPRAHPRHGPTTAAGTPLPVHTGDESRAAVPLADAALPPLLCSIAEDRPAVGWPAGCRPVSPQRRTRGGESEAAAAASASEAEAAELRRRIATFRGAFAEEARRFELAMLRQSAQHPAPRPAPHPAVLAHSAATAAATAAAAAQRVAPPSGPAPATPLGQAPLPASGGREAGGAGGCGGPAMAAALAAVPGGGRLESAGPATTVAAAATAAATAAAEAAGVEAELAGLRERVAAQERAIAEWEQWWAALQDRARAKRHAASPGEGASSGGGSSSATISSSQSAAAAAVRPPDGRSTAAAAAGNGGYGVGEGRSAEMGK